MSFSGDVKEELVKCIGGARHCQMAELAAILRHGGKVYLRSHGSRILIRTDNESVFRKTAELIWKVYRFHPEVSFRKYKNRKHSDCYCLLIDSQDAERILESLTSLNVGRSCCKRAYLRGAFLTAGSISDPDRFYHYEFVCSSRLQAEFLREMMWGLGIESKVVQRKKYHVVYVKDAGQISDLLGYTGAMAALLNFENIRIIREMRGNVNRKVNCEASNINKTANAAVKQIDDIRFLEKTIGLNGLPNGLDEMARIRLQYPVATLKELGCLFDPPIGKSGVNHRLRKLSRMAEDLRGSKEE